MIAIGIDLGTTCSCVAVFRNGNVEVIPNDYGKRVTPSFVAFCGSEILLGDSARDQAAHNPKNTIYDAKRMMGRRCDDPKIRNDLNQWPFEVVNQQGNLLIAVDFRAKRKLFTPEEISALILGKLRQMAELYLDEQIKDAVITVPAHFNDAQRKATKDAGAIAGLHVMRILNEPTAAALAYGLDKNFQAERNVLIFDLGGGTFDVSILTIEEGSVFETLATAGNPHLGGVDFDMRLVKHLVKEFYKNHDIDIRSNPKAVRRLRAAAELAKHTLSTTIEAIIDIPSLVDGVDFVTKISRERFEELCSDLFQMTTEPMEKALIDAKMTRETIQDIVMVGGSSRIPKIQSIVREFFGRKQLYNSIHPNEAVAYGAAVQAAILSEYRDSKIQQLLLVDVTPLSLGIQTAGGIMTNVIDRNTRLPCRGKRRFTTYTDNQPGVTVQVFEGERAMARDNTRLGSFELMGIPLAPKGVPKIEVTFELDLDGILHVTAEELSSGKACSIRITKDRRQLSEDDIARMLEEAAFFREIDDRQRLRSFSRNKLEAFCFQVRANIGEDGIEQDGQKAKALKVCEETLQWLESNPSAEKDEYESQYKAVAGICKPILKQLEDSSER
ncbi:heat shock protein 70 B2-like [Uranotaenia lowii]|uniref:heat shock protein 70 B2-like n=1 Tax=Uranotaenia lowii TaxID=190385 RepID=UPI0024796527|nr:heat shock protein 70 B2-like [Uranotaenia lowii]